MNQIWNLVFSIMLMLGSISFNPLPLKGGCKVTTSQNTVSRTALNFHLNFEPFWENLVRIILAESTFKISGVYVKYNTRLKYNNTTPFLLNNYLLKLCSAYARCRFYWKSNQFIILRLKLLLFFNEIKTCILRLVFLLIIFGKRWRNSYFWRLRRENLLQEKFL